MVWYLELIILGCAIVFFFSAGIPVAFAFGMINILGLYFFCGGEVMFNLLATSAYASVAAFPMVAIPMFIMMGEILTRTGTVELSFNAVQKWLRRLPGNLAIISMASATLFGALSGASMAACAAIGSIMMPEMYKRGYNKKLIAGVIIGGAGLDVLIPPSILMVIFASLSDLSVGKLLIGGTVPGVILSAFYVLMILTIAIFFPHMAPRVEFERSSLMEKIVASKHLIAMGVLIFLVLGLIYLGVASATEAAALGAGGSLLIAALYKRLTWKNFMESINHTVRVSSMIFLIFTGSKAFSQILAITGASTELANYVTSLELNRWWILIMMQLVILIMGCLMESMSIMVVMVPIYMPIVYKLGFDPIWFAILTMINIEVGLMTPPFGMNLFVTRGIAPQGITMSDIYVGVLPFISLHFLVMGLVMVMPGLATFIPSMMSK